MEDGEAINRSGCRLSRLGKSGSRSGRETDGRGSIFFKYGPMPAAFSFIFVLFLIPTSITVSISTIQIEKVWMVCLGFEPGDAVW